MTRETKQENGEVRGPLNCEIQNGKLIIDNYHDIKIVAQYAVAKGLMPQISPQYFEAAALMPQQLMEAELREAIAKEVDMPPKLMEAKLMEAKLREELREAKLREELREAIAKEAIKQENYSVYANAMTEKEFSVTEDDLKALKAAIAVTKSEIPKHDFADSIDQKSVFANAIIKHIVLHYDMNLKQLKQVVDCKGSVGKIMSLAGALDISPDEIALAIFKNKPTPKSTKDVDKPVGKDIVDNVPKGCKKKSGKLMLEDGADLKESISYAVTNGLIPILDDSKKTIITKDRNSEFMEQDKRNADFMKQVADEAIRQGNYSLYKTEADLVGEGPRHTQKLLKIIDDSSGEDKKKVIGAFAKDIAQGNVLAQKNIKNAMRMEQNRDYKLNEAIIFSSQSPEDIIQAAKIHVGNKDKRLSSIGPRLSSISSSLSSIGGLRSSSSDSFPSSSDTILKPTSTPRAGKNGGGQVIG